MRFDRQNIAAAAGDVIARRSGSSSSGRGILVAPPPFDGCVPTSLRIPAAALHDYAGAVSGEGQRSERWLALALDVLAVAGIFVLGLASTERDLPWQKQAVLLVALPLLFRRRWPLPVLVCVSGAALASSGATTGPWPQIAAVALASYTTGERATDRTRHGLAVLGVASLLAIGFLLLDAEPVTAI